jgi:ABC-type transport system involved in multi-copper enzyme maturation permease subunit
MSNPDVPAVSPSTFEPRPASAPVRRTMPSFLSSSLRIFDLSLSRMLWSRSTIFMALVVGLPVVIAAIVRGLEVAGLGGGKVDGVAISGPALFGSMIWLMYLRFIVPVLAVFYGTSLIADEVEDKTITYLFTRPIPRGAVMAGKYLAYLVCTIMVVLPSVMIVYFLVVPYGGGSIAASFPDLVKDLALLALGLIAYGALFAWVGARFKRPLLTGLIFVFGWEQAAMVFPGYLKRFTIAYYLQALVPHTMPSDNLLGMLQAIVRETPSLLTCLVSLAVITALFLWLAIRLVAKREYVLEQ